MTRCVIHIDVDAFFASVEQLLIPSLRGRPVVVGSGCIASCSYEARRFGLHAGMSLAEARRRCPSAVVLKGQYPIYRCFAEAIWRICRQYTCGLETYLDEAYGDAGGMKRLFGRPAVLGERLRRQVLDEVGLSVSVGLASNRMLAKIASSSAKPGGVATVANGREEAFLRELPVRKLPGVGPRTSEILADMNIQTVGQLRALSRSTLTGLFGRRGELLYVRSRGRDDQPLRPEARPRSISRETTFHRPTCEPNEIRAMLFYLTERAMRAMRRHRLLAGAVTLSIRYDDWKQLEARRSLAEPTADDDEAFAVVEDLLGRLYRRRVALRHVGIVLSRFRPPGQQGRLFEPPSRHRRRSLYATIDRIRDRWGHAALLRGQSIELLGRLERNDYGFILRTPSLTK